MVKILKLPGNDEIVQWEQAFDGPAVCQKVQKASKVISVIDSPFIL